MKPTLPLVALGVIQISYIYCSAVHRAGKDRHTGRRQAVHRGTRWNEDKRGHQRRPYTSSNDLVFKSQGLKASNILLSFSMASSQPYKPEAASSRTSGRRGSKTSEVTKRGPEQILHNHQIYPPDASALCTTFYSARAVTMMEVTEVLVQY